MVTMIVMNSLTSRAEAAGVIGVEGMAFGDSSVVRAYAGFNLSESIRIIAFGLDDRYSEDYDANLQNKYRINGLGVAGQYLMSDTNFYAEVHTFRSDVSIQGINNGVSSDKLSKTTNWVGAAVGYDYPVTESFFLNVVLSSSAAASAVDLTLPGAVAECDGLAKNRFCIKAGEFSSQIRFGLSYRF